MSVKSENERVTEEKTPMKDKVQTGTALLTYGADDFDDQPEANSFKIMNVGKEEDDLTEIEGYAMQIGSDGKLPSTWILLDNQSTVDVFSNQNLITDIRETSSTMNLHCNAGITSTNMIGELRG